jgi:hypothetical protein
VQSMPSAVNCRTVSSASDALSSTMSNRMIVKCQIPFGSVTIVWTMPISP